MADEREPRRYHHGDLREALVDQATALLAERGLPGFSVAEVARRAGVSSAAPYRHFADRETLLAAVAQVAARDLSHRLQEAVRAAGPDPVEQVARAAGAYARFVRERGVGLDLIYLPDLESARFAALHEDTRDLMTLLIRLHKPLPMTVDFEARSNVVGDVFVLAHGHATGAAADFLRSRPLGVEELELRVVTAARLLVAGHLAADAATR